MSKPAIVGILEGCKEGKHSNDFALVASLINFVKSVDTSIFSVTEYDDRITIIFSYTTVHHFTLTFYKDAAIVFCLPLCGTFIINNCNYNVSYADIIKLVNSL